MSGYARTYDAAMAELAATDMWQSNYAPPLLHFSRKLGRQARPPHYVPFWRAFAACAVWFGPVWGLAMWGFDWRFSGMPVLGALMTAVLAGILFGGFMAGYYAWGRKKYRLSRWEDL